MELSVVVPVYNEAEVVEAAGARLVAVLEGWGEPYEILWVDDGSCDATPALLAAMANANPSMGVLTLSRNFGHQVAITAGLEHAAGRAAVVMDADLQDPPELIPRMVAKWREGYAVVHARRLERRGDGAVKRWTAAVFARALRRMADVPPAEDAGDFRLVDRAVVEALRRMPERQRFVRAMVSWTGFPQASVSFVRDPRAAGRSKYTTGRMISLAMDGFTSSSARPLYLVGYAGAALTAACALSLALLGVLAASGERVAGWLFAAAALGVADGAVLVGLGVIGAYVARIHTEVQARPLYVLSGLRPPAGGRGARPSR